MKKNCSFISLSFNNWNFYNLFLLCFIFLGFLKFIIFVKPFYCCTKPWYVPGIEAKVVNIMNVSFCLFDVFGKAPSLSLSHSFSISFFYLSKFIGVATTLLVFSSDLTLVWRDILFLLYMTHYRNEKQEMQSTDKRRFGAINSLVSLMD